MRAYKYKFSVVIPIYNVEEYLEEAIESVINQTIGFEKNIQLILVNDGSKDKSEDICLKYKEIYPNNVVYVKQQNAGVSETRNNGIKYIEGKYVNFLDGDDKWELDVFEKIYKIFEENQEKVDIVVCRKKLFEAKEDYHLLDYKFEETKIVDILEDYDYIHLHITSSFIKSEVAKQYKFDTKLKYGEDAKYVNEIILKKCKYMVVKEAIHYYRRRYNYSSAIQNKEKDIRWYTDTINYFYKDLMGKSKKRFGKIILYIQFLIMYDLQWRIKTPLPKFLNKEMKNEYIENIVKLLQDIDDWIICKQKNIYTEHKIYALSLKYQKDIKEDLVYINGKLYFNNIPIFRIRNNDTIFKIDILELDKGILKLQGRVNSAIPKEYFKIYLKVNSREDINIQLEEGKKSLYTKNTFGLERKILNHYTFNIEIPLYKVKRIRFILQYKNEARNKLEIRFGGFAKMNNQLENTYYAKGKYLIKYKDKNIIVKRNSKFNRLKQEFIYIKELVKNKKVNLIFYRILYYIYKSFNKKEIWLISDRENIAGDNGETFFNYVIKNKNKRIKPFFIIDAKSEDYKRIKKIGKTIKLNSIKYKLYFLMANKIISSQANDYVLNGFKEDEIYMKDLYNFDFIFLQHGIIEGDLSKWLEKYNKNIKIFITSAKAEYDSIINGDYYYTENQIKLTGCTRYDKLKDNKKKSIIILPTQRRRLVEWNSKAKENNIYNPYFKNSKCFKFYNKIINDERLLKCLKDNGYKMKLGLHPLQLKQAIDFKGNEYVEVLKHEINYSKEFEENSLLITDYSSVAFDFAYLKKPVIYTQFDKDTFYEGQVYDKGYFEYEKDGFGPVCYDYETTVQTIINYIENDCTIEEKYLDRINKFYAYHDKNNCKRVYEEILKL